MKKVLITLHGVGTRGVWQKSLATYFSKLEQRWVLYPLDYGYFAAPGLLVPYYITRKVDWFVNQYRYICNEEGIDRPSIIAHSFGCLVILKALQKYGDIKFDKIIFCGSIASAKFEWEEFIESERVLFVHNDYSKRDIWPLLASLIFWSGCGNSGWRGFVNTVSSSFLDKQNRYFLHSDYFNNIHVDNNWLPTLNCTKLTYNQKIKAQALIPLLIREMSRISHINQKYFRVTFFFPNRDNNLEIHPELTYGEFTDQEKRLKFAPGLGCVGNAWSKKEIVFSAKKKGLWKVPIHRNEGEHLHNDLKWVVSIPVPYKDNAGYYCVLSFDCLKREFDTKYLANVQNFLVSSVNDFNTVIGA